MTATEAIARYLQSLAARSRATQRAYAAGLRHFVAWFDSADYGISSANPISELPPDVLEDYWLGMIEADVLKPASRSLYLAAARGMITWAAAHRHLPAAWPLATALFNLRQLVRTEPYHSPRLNGEAEAIWKAAQEAKLPQKGIARLRLLRDRAIIAVLYASGIRRQELCSINRRDVDFETRRVRVLGKGGKERTTFLSQEAVAAFAAYLLEVPMGSQEAAFIAHPHDRRIAPDVVRGALARFGGPLGIKFHPHGFRHAYAQRMLKAGVSPHAIQAMLGHASVDTTMTVYAAYAVEDLQTTYEKAEQAVRRQNA